jgi:GNAT superfamily N-acetyltransferase
MTAIEIRPYRSGDGAFRERVAPRLDPGDTASPRDRVAFAAFFERFGRGEPDDDGEGFVAVDAEDRPLGMIVLLRDRDYFTGHPRAYVNVLVVDEAAEGSGVGRALMGFAERWARDRGCREVCLDVFAGNARAIAFYERNGYRVDHLRMTKPVP